TMYDIASLTKVVATTTLVAKLAEGDFAVPLDLDAKIERYLPEWASGPQPEWRHRVTVRHLLTHTSGLPAFTAYWRTSKSKQATREFSAPRRTWPRFARCCSTAAFTRTKEFCGARRWRSSPRRSSFPAGRGHWVGRCRPRVARADIIFPHTASGTRDSRGRRF